MTRSILLACMLTLASLGGCSRSPETPAGNAVANEAENSMTVEDVPSDSLAAPADMPLDSESNTGGSNAM